jgi:hypothetical protein
MIPMSVIAVAFTVSAMFCLYDVVVSPRAAHKIFRMFEAAICVIAAFYYWVATIAMANIPSTNLRFVWLSLCIVLCSEIISRQDWGSKK